MSLLLLIAAAVTSLHAVGASQCSDHGLIEPEEKIVSLLQRGTKPRPAVLAHVETAGFPDADKNYCMSGRLAPTVFVLGVQKSGTTAFCEDFHEYNEVQFAENAKVVEPDREWGEKEPFIFNDLKRFNAGVDFWLEHYPECQQNQSQVAIDCTPYLGTGTNSLGLLERIHQRYGDDFSRLKFVVLLREPVSRMQSAYHFASDRSFPEEYRDFKNFTSYVEHVLAKEGDFTTMDDGENYTENIYNITNYALLLDNLLTQPGIDPKQLLVYPMELAFSDLSLATQELAMELGIKSTRSHSAEPVPNQGHHPRLEDELQASTLTAMRKKLNATQSVAKVLASHGVGARLYGYSGSPTDEAAIAEWLEKNW